MPALVLDGKSLAAQTEADLLQRVERLKQKSGGKAPILATILVGDDPASATYVKMKGNACRRVGMDSLAVEMPAATTTDGAALLERIAAFPPQAHEMIYLGVKKLIDYQDTRYAHLYLDRLQSLQPFEGGDDAALAGAGLAYAVARCARSVGG